MTDDAATILVVEDDLATRTFLADNLTADGYEVLACDTARDALRRLEANAPDLLLLDLGLPDLGGLEVLRRIRGADGLTSRMDPGTPVMLLTGRAGEIDRVRGFERGADDYLCKVARSGDHQRTKRRRPPSRGTHKPKCRITARGRSVHP